MHELRGAPEPSLMDIVEKLAPCDLILIEGYKREKHPKIEARRSDARKQTPLAADDPQIRAIATDNVQAVMEDLPAFSLDDVDAIADFILAACGLPLARGARHARN